MYRGNGDIGCIEVKACRLGAPLEVRCELICSVEERKFMVVSPEEVRWITEYPTIYEVDSNTVWEVF